jgi:hypothetical protein
MSLKINIMMENRGINHTAVTAKLNWLIGCRVGGHLSRISSTKSGMEARAAQSLESCATCSCVGTSPVTRSQNRPSGSGSDPPGAFGSCSWHSGIVLPRKRMPSSAASLTSENDGQTGLSYQHPGRNRPILRLRAYEFTA